MALCVIPARSGSKRIPNKNIKFFLGKPMVAWAIELAYESSCFDEIIVSTDTLEIKDIAEKFGAKVPFLRPKDLSDDYSPTVSVIRHAISFYPAETEICCLYPASPLICAEDIREGFRKLKSCDFVMPVTSFAHPIERALLINPRGFGEMAHMKNYSTRSQDLTEYYHDVGAFYWGLTEAWLTFTNPFEADVGFVNIPRHRAQDIDTPEDWKFAEYLVSYREASKMADTQ